ncbi:MAG TPA: FAD-dependent oxidoreductase [Phycisphaerae bacterium]|nr:FAD-dependent oxidoreductase [Phycisphaerae bacterium]
MRMTRRTLCAAAIGLVSVLSGWAPALALQVVDVQGMRLVSVPDDAVAAESRQADIVILGGSLGGVAAALAACDEGRTVILTEETDWLGGQATSQGVSALDENRWIETTGGTRSYLDFRRRIRDWYRKNTKLTPQARDTVELDPGNSWVTRLGFEPKVGVAVIDDMLAPHRTSGKLSTLMRHKIARAQREGSRIQWVEVVDLQTGELTRLTGTYFIDATELGEPLVVCRVQHVVGAESREQTGEPHARTDGPHPECVQSFTYPFALRLQSEPGKPVARVPNYEHHVVNQPYTFMHLYYDQRGWVRYGMFERVEGSYGPFWTYRRLIDKTNFDDPAYGQDVAMINWPGNDYRRMSLITDEPEQMLQALREAKELALGFCHWLQTDAPRDEGGKGYPEAVLDASVMGTSDGLSKYPYIRESRRIKALYTIVEQDVAAEFFKDQVRARHFADSVGIGWYGIDIHPNDAETKLPPAATKPFQIPLGALISVDTDNLLAACKNIGTTHITNGCYRLHPVEWNLGEAAGLLAARCIRSNETPRQIHSRSDRVLELQRQLVARGVPIFWYDDVGPADADFAQAQLTPFTDPAELRRVKNTLSYRPPR